MNKQHTLTLSVAVSAICGILACGGGGNTPVQPVIATRLAYADPGGSGYRLLRGTNSTQNTLVLELRGPASETGRGVTFGLQIGDTTRAKFVKVDSLDAEYAQNGTVLQLGTDPQLFKAVLDGNNYNVLRVSMAQKGQGNDRHLDGALARVAVQLQPGVTQGTIPLTAINDARLLPANGGSVPITIAVGTLTAQ